MQQQGDDASGKRSRRTQLASVSDVAERAAVSPATVDRVLNRRPGVRPATVNRVLKAAVELGYIPESEIEAARPGKPIRVTFLLPAGSNRFLSMLGRSIVAAGETMARSDVRAKVEFVESFNPDLLARQLREQGRNADGIAFMAIEHPAVREAVNDLAERGVPAVTLISDIANSRRAAYLGLENRSAGRTAASLLSRFIGRRPATVAMIAGSRSYRAHEEREMGFLHFLEEMAPEVQVVGLREGLDEEARNYRHTRTLIGQYPDLDGIYNIGGAPEGVAKALKEASRDREIVFVGHGLTLNTRGLLLDGTMDAVITQNPSRTIAACGAIFANIRGGADPLQGVEPLQTEIILRENLP
ncbi:transcriptional regulator, LacI family [Faunimonas pinastri]|uniref:Transcriptional regulator, LacI family n=1 Tax=Faunimonas pinastri TaxID=1855383 RepID=A0A1H9B2U3_9HYPH|nr:LacI family DNA-binding transcriptional regulator [Faunimonas pinastri]SEP83380.1 transcriptional regulator, LacI family [Faunimonas pinastri]